MEIIKSILTQNDCYRANRKINVKGLMIHSVGCSQPNASVFIKQWNQPNVEKCVHAFIEPNGKVYQTLPWDMRGWHAGGNANNTHVGVEMTEPATIKYVNGSAWIDNNPTKTKEHVLATYQVAVELFAYLCKKFNLNPLADGVIISHHEGNIRGIASNHGDVEHIWAKFGLTMKQFREDIQNAMTKEENKPETNENNKATELYRVRKSWTDVCSQIGAYSILDNAIKQAKANDGYKVYDENGNQVYPPVNGKSVDNNPVNSQFLVKVTADALNIRKGPGTNYSITGVIKDKGVYTIVETNDTWGKLKSGAGWISLKYTEMLDNKSTQTEDKPKTIDLKVGDKVKVKSGAKTYTGGNLASFVYQNTYNVIQINGDRVVIGIGTAVTAAIHKDNLILL
jgi:hypothetical protein